MGVLNRRNAVVGWAVLKLGKRAAKRKAKSAVPRGGDGRAKRGIGAGILSALAAGGGALWFWRRKRGDDEAEKPKPSA